MTSLPPRTWRATSRRIVRSPFLSSPPPMMIRQPRRRSSDIRFLLLLFPLAQPCTRPVLLAGDHRDGEGRAVMRPADPPVLGDADAAAVAGEMRQLVDRFHDRAVRAQIVDP